MKPVNAFRIPHMRDCLFKFENNQFSRDKHTFQSLDVFIPPPILGWDITEGKKCGYYVNIINHTKYENKLDEPRLTIPLLDILLLVKDIMEPQSEARILYVIISWRDKVNKLTEVSIIEQQAAFAAYTHRGYTF